MPNVGHPAAQPGKRRYCWLAQFSGAPCDGRWAKVHLIPQQVIKREVGRAHKYVWDSRVWVWACGGPMGCSGHHGMLDYSRTLRVPRERLPECLEAFAVEHGLTWWLDREYGALAEA